MKKQIITSNAPSPTGAYSQAIVTDSDRIYISAQMPMDPETKEIPLSIEDQTIQVLLNIKNILTEASFSINDVAKVTVYLNNNNDFKQFNNIYKTFFEEPYPARSVIKCDLEDELIEMDIIAEK
jgi:2-iminobutanoate/2-iminopropanoate deaminase